MAAPAAPPADVRFSFSNMFRDPTPPPTPLPTPPPTPVPKNLGRNRSNAFNERNIFSENRVKEMNKAALGYVLVWDMDQTITGDYFDVKEYPAKPLDINSKAIEILRLAVKARNEGRVAAILLLTNNSDKDYIFKMIQTVTQSVFGAGIKRTDRVFDEGLMAGSEGRNVPPGKSINHALKSFRDVRKMLKMLGLSTINLPARTFFFDDQPGHVLTAELIKEGYEDNFIQITPGYKERQVDETNWSYIEKVLGEEQEQDGGYNPRKKRVKGYTKHIKRVGKKYSRKCNRRVCA